MSQKYCKKLNPIIVPWREGSHIWRRILECRDLIEHQIVRHTKMGSSLFWYENWTGLEALYFLMPPNFAVDELINNVYEVVDAGSWNVDKLMESLREEYAIQNLENIKASVSHEVLDKSYWILETKGNFSVKTTWEYLRRRKEPGLAYNKMWVKGLPFKISFFLRKVLKSKIPLDDFMKRL